MALHHILHIGDTHLSPGPRQADRLAALDQMLAQARERAAQRTLAAIWWPGDLFHARSTVEDRNALSEIVRAFAALAPVLIVPGNHDQPGELAIFAKLASTWPIQIITTPQVIQLDGATGLRLSVFCLPYPSRGALVASGAAHAALPVVAEHALQPIFMGVADELQTRLEVGDAIAMIGHVNVGGAVSSVGQPQIGTEIELTPALLATLPAGLPIALNHIHKHQVIHGAVYAGSIAALDFGETEDKGFIEWTFDDTVVRLDAGASWSWRFVELVSAKPYLIDGRLTPSGFTYDDETARRPWAGHDVRVRYRFTKAEVSAIDVAHIYAEFAEARSLKLEPIAELAHQVRLPQIVAAPSLAEKVDRYAEHHGIGVTDTLRAKVSALQGQDTAALLAAVRASVRDADAAPAPAETAVA